MYKALLEASKHKSKHSLAALRKFHRKSIAECGAYTQNEKIVKATSITKYYHIGILPGFAPWCMTGMCFAYCLLAGCFPSTQISCAHKTHTQIDGSRGAKTPAICHN
jgi:hypothetical protein